MFEFDTNINLVKNSISLLKDKEDKIIDFVVKEIAQNFYNIWVRKGLLHFNSTAIRYISAIKIDNSQKNKSVVYLDDKDFLPLALEKGKGAYDLKPFLLESEKVKKNSKGKKYINIPFQTNNVPKKVSNMLSERQRATGLKKGEFEEKTFRNAISNIETKQTFQKYNYKSSIFEGAMQTTKGGIITFRTVSEDSDKDSFIHKGFIAANLGEKSLGKNLEYLANLIVKDIIT